MEIWFIYWVTFEDISEFKYSVALLEQQEAGQTVCRGSINSEDFVFDMFIVSFQYLWLCYGGAYIWNLMYFALITWIHKCSVYLVLPEYFQAMCFGFPSHYVNS